MSSRTLALCTQRRGGRSGGTQEPRKRAARGLPRVDGVVAPSRSPLRRRGRLSTYSSRRTRCAPAPFSVATAKRGGSRNQVFQKQVHRPRCGKGKRVALRQPPPLSVPTPCVPRDRRRSARQRVGGVWVLPWLSGDGEDGEVHRHQQRGVTGAGLQAIDGRGRTGRRSVLGLLSA